MDSILDIRASYKKVNKYTLRFKIKPWTTLTLQKSISFKNSLLKKFINCNDSQTKEHLHTRYKDYNSLLSSILKRSKTNYYNQRFDTIGATLKILRKI